MSAKEWRSMDEIARSTIRMQLTLCGRNYTMCTRRNPPHQSWYWFDRYSTWRWERRIHLPPISTPSVGCYLNSPPKGSTSTKKLKPLSSFRACGELGGILHNIHQQLPKPKLRRNKRPSPHWGHSAKIDGTHYRWVNKSPQFDRVDREI